jgi:DNA polymerase-3 subunit beta
MKLTVNRLSFLKALQTADRAVPVRTMKDILKNVKLVSTTNQIVLTSTDGEISLRIEVADVTLADGGECLLPTSRLIQILSELTNDAEVRFDIDNREIWIRGGLSEFKILTEDPREFPPVATFTDEAYFRMNSSDLRRLIKRTIFASDSESTRYALGGIQVEFANSLAIFAATDSRRLAVDQAPCEKVGSPLPPSIPPVVPQKAMKLLLSLAEDEGFAMIAFNANGLSVKVGLAVLTTQFVQGRFPDWRKVMPTSAEVTIDLVCAPFFGAIRQAMIMRNEESRAIDFSFSKGKLRLKAEVADMGASKIDMPIAYDGAGMEISFEPQYFADFLKVLDSSQQVQLKLISKDDPALLQIDDYRCIIMPLSRDK